MLGTKFGGTGLGYRVRWAGLLVGWLAMFAGCNGDEQVLEFQVVTPETTDPFEHVAQVLVRLQTDTDTQEETATVADGRLDVSVTAPFGARSRLEIEGRDAGGRLVAYGRTPVFYAVGSAVPLGVWFSQVDSIAKYPYGLTNGVARPASATYVRPVWDTLDHEPFYTFWFGGCDGTGAPVDEAGYLDPYYLFVGELPALSDSANWADQDRPVEPTCGAVAGSLADGNFFFLGGVGEAGRATDQLVVVLAQSDGFVYARMGMECEDGVDNDGDGKTDTDDEDCSSRLDLAEGGDYAVSDAAVAVLGPYASLWDGQDWRVVNSFLVFGGMGPDGVRSTAFHLLAESSATSSGYRFRIEPLEMGAARLDHCAAATGSRTGDVERRSALVFGGSGTDGPAAELFEFELDAASPQLGWEWKHQQWDDDSDGNPIPVLAGPACVALSGARILVCGGRSADGQSTADCWLYEQGSAGLVRLPALLGRGRSHGVLVRAVGDLVVWVGGLDESGGPAGDAVVLNVPESGDATRLEEVDLPGPALEVAGFTWANGQPVFLGGLDADGHPTKDIYIANFGAGADSQ